MKKLKILSTIVIFLNIFGCSEDFINLEPQAQVTPEQLSELPDSKLIGVFQGKLNGVYGYLQRNGNIQREPYSGVRSWDIVADMYASDMVMTREGYGWFWDTYQINEHVATYRRTYGVWETCYNQIYTLNGILETMTEVPDDPQLKSIYAQASALRAFQYFKLINWYQQPYSENPTAPGVPLIVSSSAEPIGRGTVQQVYDQIISDLNAASMVFSDPEVTGLPNTTLNPSATAGLYAQVAMTMGDYSTAAQKANEAKEGFPLMSTDEWVDGFHTITNPEWMWAIDINSETTGKYDSYFSHVSNIDPGYSGAIQMYKIIDAALFNEIDTSDCRYEAFSNDGEPFNFKFYNDRDQSSNWLSDYVLMRSAEMYLIEAEAKARTGDESGAIELMTELINARCFGTDPYNITSLSGQELLNMIHVQARIELWGEGKSLWYGKRFKRTFVRNYPGTNHPEILDDYTWDDPKLIHLIPQNEINNNPEISEADQNL
ncbi:RagB/SusD family nutrient uptake outer membrane protein [Draconibacterium sp.]|nr:RagB/SusD family nutrient uptake outer membrane protein [Draconibacterium sp.]